MAQTILDPCLSFKKKESEFTGLIGTLVDDTLGTGSTEFALGEETKSSNSAWSHAMSLFLCCSEDHKFQKLNLVSFYLRLLLQDYQWSEENSKPAYPNRHLYWFKIYLRHGNKIYICHWKRLLIDLSALREAYVSGAVHNLGHILSEYIIADPLTKKMNHTTLIKLLEKGTIHHPVNQWIIHEPSNVDNGSQRSKMGWIPWL